MSKITIEFYNSRTGEYETKEVSKKDFIKAKTADLRNFGYADLTEDQVGKQLEIALSGEGKLDVIGLFIEGDLVKEK